MENNPNPISDRKKALLQDTGEIDLKSYKNRIAICGNCEHYTFTKQCSKCFCFMPIKARIKSMKCPIGKW